MESRGAPQSLGSKKEEALELWGIVGGIGWKGVPGGRNRVKGGQEAQGLVMSSECQAVGSVVGVLRDAGATRGVCT